MSDGDGAPIERVRLDVWLWRARFFRTRPLAARAVKDGAIRVNSARVRKPSHGLKEGDVLTISRPANTAVVELRAHGERRGPAVESQSLYRDLSERRAQPD